MASGKICDRIAPYGKGVLTWLSMFVTGMESIYGKNKSSYSACLEYELC
ncbi:MAG: hypothetical protein HPY66_0967 [Firmicutes bacterium]|nr:hypothetical protein [Bacillota bacterium]